MREIPITLNVAEPVVFNKEDGVWVVKNPGRFWVDIQQVSEDVIEYVEMQDFEELHSLVLKATIDSEGCPTFRFTDSDEPPRPSSLWASLESLTHTVEDLKAQVAALAEQRPSNRTFFVCAERVHQGWIGTLPDCSIARTIRDLKDALAGFRATFGKETTDGT